MRFYLFPSLSVADGVWGLISFLKCDFILNWLTSQQDLALRLQSSRCIRSKRGFHLLLAVFFTSSMCERWPITGPCRILPYRAQMRVCLLRRVKYSRLWTRMMLSGGRPGRFQISVPVLDLYPQIIFLKGKEALILLISGSTISQLFRLCYLEFS